MLDQEAVRQVLATAFEDQKPDGLTVYARGVDGALSMPCVIIAQSRIAEFDLQACEVDRWEWPVQVGVARTGIDEEATQQELQSLLAWAVGVLRQLLRDDPYLDAADVANARLVRADFGTGMSVQGQAFPAYEIILEIDG